MNSLRCTKQILSVVILTVSFFSFSQDPGWNVNAASFSNSMTVTAVLQTDCAELQNSANRLGAFVGNDIRGSALSSTMVNGKYIALLTVYSNQVSGETISFKIYNSATNMIVDAITTLEFEDDASFGTPSNPLLITENNIPNSLTLSNAAIDENNSVGDVVGTFSASDIDAGQTFTFSLVTGAGDDDNASFSITGSDLEIQESANFEVQESYSIRVRVQDDLGCFEEKSFTISVNEINEAPTDLTLSSMAVDEGVSSPTEIGMFTTQDEDANESFIYSFATGAGDADNGIFEINGTKLISSQTFDFETQNSYSIRVRTTDSRGEFFEKSFLISINDVNEIPSNLQLDNNEIVENQAIGTSIGIFSATDQDNGDVLTFTMVNGDNDNSTFTLDGNELKSGEVFNFETKPNYTIEIQVTDSKGLSVQKAFVINVLDQEETPTDIQLSNTDISENNTSPLEVATISSADDDADETFTYSLVAGTGDADNATFRIEGDKLMTDTEFDYESKSTYSIRLKTTDSGNEFFEKEFTINVLDVNESPSNLQIDNKTLTENQPIGTLIGTLSADDPDNGEILTYTFINSDLNDNDKFLLNGAELSSGQIFDFENKFEYSIEVSVTDSKGVAINKIFRITILDQEETPTDIQLSNNLVSEGNFVPLEVATISSIDDDANETFTYSLVGGTGDADNATFRIEGDKLITDTEFDFEAKSTYSIRIRTTDSGNEFLEKEFTITIRDINEPPFDLVLSNHTVSENETVGTIVGVLGVSDQDNPETLTFKLVATGLNDNNLFELDGLNLITREVFNYEIKNEYTLHVEATDSENQAIQETFKIEVIDVEEAPTDILISNSTVLEGNDVPLDIATFTSEDDDLNETFTYSLVAGAGDTDNGTFTIESNRLLTSTIFDYENQSSYAIRVRTTDSANETFEKSFVIAIGDRDEGPYDFTISNQSIDENQPAGTVVGVLNAEDEDIGAVITFSFNDVEGFDNQAFLITGNELKTASSFNFEEKDSYNVLILATDDTGLSIEGSWEITINDINEIPSNLELSADTFKEDQPVGSLIGVLSSYDDDTEDTVVYSLTGFSGENNNNLVAIDGDQLVSTQVFDFEVVPSLVVEITATDSQGASVTETFTIDIEEISAQRFPSIDVVTPNGDGINDTWVIQGVEDFTNYSVKIFNTNGQMVYYVPGNYNNDWDGSNDGTSLSTGTYYYEVQNNTFPQKKFTGTLSLIKK